MAYYARRHVCTLHGSLHLKCHTRTMYNRRLSSSYNNRLVLWDRKPNFHFPFSLLLNPVDPRNIKSIISSTCYGTFIFAYDQTWYYSHQYPTPIIPNQGITWGHRIAILLHTTILSPKVVPRDEHVEWSYEDGDWTERFIIAYWALHTTIDSSFGTESQTFTFPFPSF